MQASAPGSAYCKYSVKFLVIGIKMIARRITEAAGLPGPASEMPFVKAGARETSFRINSSEIASVPS